MSRFQIISIVEQVAAHLRGEVLGGRWGETLPGIHPLAAELGVNHKTVEKALHLLENEGYLIGKGPGRRRLIALPENPVVAHSLRIAILVGDPETKQTDYMLRLQHALVEAGYRPFFTPGSLSELGMDLGRIGKLVRKTQADAWLVNAGSREVLEWFSAQTAPAFALFGRRHGLPIASIGPDKPKAMAEVIQRLHGLGHSKIVYLCRKRRRIPEPGASEKAFLSALQALGIPQGPYNLPDWDETPEGLHRCLKSLFQLTPPTAVIVDESPFLIAALQFFGQRDIHVPEDVSLLVTDPDPALSWCQPAAAHLSWDSGPWVRRVVRWAGNVSRGKEDVQQRLTRVSFIEAGTIGPARSRSPR